MSSVGTVWNRWGELGLAGNERRAHRCGIDERGPVGQGRALSPNSDVKTC